MAAAQSLRTDSDISRWSSDGCEAVLFDEREKFEGCALWFFFAALPLRDEIDGDSEMAGEDSLAGLFLFSNSSYLAGGQRLYRSQTHLIEMTHGHLVHHSGIVKVFDGLMDGGKDRATIFLLRRGFLQGRRS